MKGLWTYLIEDTLETTEFQNIDLMMIDSVYVSKEYRTKMAEILFEELKVSLLYLGKFCDFHECEYIDSFLLWRNYVINILMKVGL